MPAMPMFVSTCVNVSDGSFVSYIADQRRRNQQEKTLLLAHLQSASARPFHHSSRIRSSTALSIGGEISPHTTSISVGALVPRRSYNTEVTIPVPHALSRTMSGPLCWRMPDCWMRAAAVTLVAISEIRYDLPIFSFLNIFSTIVSGRFAIMIGKC